jgi:hypothetical protein
MVNAQIRQFYKDAEQLFHEFAKVMGFAEQGVLAVPDLQPKRDQFVISVLRDEQLIKQCHNDANIYYYNVMRYCLTAGMEYAVQWHVKPEGFEEEGYDNILYTNVMQRSSSDIVSKICDSPDDWEKFQIGLYGTWTKLLEPEFQSDDIDDKIINSFFAMFQLGVSIALDKWGY